MIHVTLPHALNINSRPYRALGSTRVVTFISNLEDEGEPVFDRPRDQAQTRCEASAVLGSLTRSELEVLGSLTRVEHLVIGRMGRGDTEETQIPANVTV